MSSNESDFYEIVLPASLEAELVDALKEAAAENGAASHYTLAKQDSAKAVSELNFDPFTVAAGIYVGKLIISGVSSYFIRKALDRVATKLQEARSKDKSNKGVITVIMPDGSVEKIDPADPAALSAALNRISPAPSGK
jgi:hypothetical protein